MYIYIREQFHLFHTNTNVFIGLMISLFLIYISAGCRDYFAKIHTSNFKYGRQYQKGKKRNVFQNQNIQHKQIRPRTLRDMLIGASALTEH